MTEQVFTKRCTPAERAAIERIEVRAEWPRVTRSQEPALGSVSERLDILIRRFGGRTRIVLTAAERAQLEQCRVSE